MMIIPGFIQGGLEAKDDDILHCQYGVFEKILILGDWESKLKIPSHDTIFKGKTRRIKDIVEDLQDYDVIFNKGNYYEPTGIFPLFLIKKETKNMIDDRGLKSKLTVDCYEFYRLQESGNLVFVTCNETQKMYINTQQYKLLDELVEYAEERI